MAMQQVQTVAEQYPGNDTAEIKQRTQQYVVDETLSEWELARQCSKTWSMEQE